MPATSLPADSARYARTIEASKRVRWDIDQDVLRGRRFDLADKFMPDGLSLVDELDFLSADQGRFLGQVQGRTYGHMFALVERFIGAKMLELSRDHALGDQTALEAIVRLTDEELKHQELFRRVERLVAEGMPEGYRFEVDANEVAGFVLGKGTWAVLALTCHIELFSQAHYRESIETAEGLSPLFKDIFLFHWKEEAQHAVVDELEWVREDARLASNEARDAAVGELIELVGGVDGILQGQAAADAGYFLRVTGIPADGERGDAVRATLLKAYRWQYIVSGAVHPRFTKLLGQLVDERQLGRIQAALAPLAYAMPARPAALAH
jgi:DNA-binding Lrp family transcriptional regulator